MSPSPSLWQPDLVLTLGIAATAILGGTWLRDRVGWLRRANIPGAAVGGLVVATIVLLLRRYIQIELDSTLRTPLQMAFFASIGFQVTLSVLRAGGRAMVLFWVIACGTAVVQNIAGVVGARALGVSPLIGLICGSVTLTGGPATGLAFTDMFQSMGVPAAGEAIIAAATFGIFMSSLIGNPAVTPLIRRLKLSRAEEPAKVESKPAGALDWSLRELLKSLVVLSLTMAVGSLIGAGLAAMRIRISVVIGPMLAAAVVRWIDDNWGVFKLNHSMLHALGTTSLAFFLAVALGALKLWELSALAAPMMILLVMETVLTVAYCFGTTWFLMGRDYDAAVMTSGHIGFGLGITANAVANMEELVERYGPAPRAFLIVPAVGGFFIDFANSLIISGAAVWLSR